MIGQLDSFHVGENLRLYTVLDNSLYFNVMLKYLKLNFKLMIVELPWTTDFLLRYLMKLIKKKNSSNLLKK